MNRYILRIALVALLVAVSQGTLTLAATTGALSGYVRTAAGAGLADAKVAAAALSETATATTDASGHYVFISLIPDTYTVTASKDGYTTLATPGVTVIAGNTRSLDFTLQPALKTLGVVTTTAAATLVKPGTTNDVYSVNSATQAKVATLGGGGSLYQAYSAIATTPGAIVPPGGIGWYQTVNIRGGDADQIGYEFDGIPVLRSYDNYPTTNASNLGQQELQVYTGAPPANSQNQGLAGYINQVIKSGTYPGFANVNASVGTPQSGLGGTFEVGGATPDRNFSYFLGSSNSNAEPRYFDNFNGAYLQSTYGAPISFAMPTGGSFANPLAGCANPAVAKNYSICYASGIGPGGYLLSSPTLAVFASNVYDHENVVNLHFGLPHRDGSGKDDIQLLYDSSYLWNEYFSSASDWGFSDPNYASTFWSFQNLFNGSSLPATNREFYLGNSPFGQTGFEYQGQVGAPLATNYKALTVPVIFAYNPQNATSPYIDFNQRDGTGNTNSIIKLQYQKNFSSSAYLRIYGYNNYSEWPQTCPDTGPTFFIGWCPLNYYVASWTNGGALEFGDQINDRNLVTFNLSDSLATEYRANDTTMLSSGSFAYVVSKNNPQSGVCYDPTGTAVSCFSGTEEKFSLAAANAGAALPALPAGCGGAGNCEWFVTENGRHGGGNFAKPNFGTVSITDQLKASERWFFNLGLREDRFFYQLSDTNCPAEAQAAGCARQFWFNAWNNSVCVLPGGGQVPGNLPGEITAPNAPCPAVNGIQTGRATLTNLPSDTETFWVFQPRFGTTYTAGPNDVFRFSYGRVDQAPNTAFEQYNLLQQDLAAYDGTNFWPVGFTTTTHHIYPPTANDLDLSWEHHFAGTQGSMKVTPYYRTTNNQIQNFFLNQKTNFVSGLNVGQQTSEGLEFQTTWGNFNENGVSVLLAYTYDHSYIKQKQLGTGGTVYDTINLAIQRYNSFTSACAGVAPSTSTTSLCGTFGGTNAVATELSGVANPYFNAPSQARLDPNGQYIPFGTIPGGIEAATGSYEIPHAATLVLNYKRNKWAISPQFQFFAGTQYGDPLSGYGVDPSTCSALTGATVSGDPRYPYGGTGTPYDATTCGGTVAAPNPYTHVFDSLGAFHQPNQFLMHLQLSYDFSPRVSFVANVANLVDRCFGGTKAAWTVNATGNSVCGYGLPGWGAPLPYGANIYNPGSTFLPEVQFPYQEDTFTSPLEMNFGVHVKL